MATAIYNNCYTCWNGCPTNASNMGICLRSDLPDADAVGLARLTNVPDVDVIGARGKTYAGSVTQRNITIAGGVVAERVKSNGCITVASCVGDERILTLDGVAVCQARILTSGSRLRRKRK